jgi:hypothetical protein
MTCGSPTGAGISLLGVRSVRIVEMKRFPDADGRPGNGIFNPAMIFPPKSLLFDNDALLERSRRREKSVILFDGTTGLGFGLHAGGLCGVRPG